MTKICLNMVAALCVAGAATSFLESALADDEIDGEIIYRETCSVCHGDDGSGAMWGRASLATPPRNFRSEQARRELSVERMVASVAGGRPGTPMPGFATQLNMDQINAVVAYIREEFMAEPGSLSASAHPAAVADYHRAGATVAGRVADAETKTSADVDRGRALYEANCVACHGAGGGGDGPRAYFIFPKPRNFLDPSTRAYLGWQNIFTGIKFGVVGKEMPAWGKVLGDQQIADLAEYVHRSFIARAAETPAAR